MSQVPHTETIWLPYTHVSIQNRLIWATSGNDFATGYRCKAIVRLNRAVGVQEAVVRALARLAAK